MKGLILKDWYLLKDYCKVYLLLIIVFTVASFWSQDSLFLLLYPCILASVIPVTLLSYDERSHWESYCGALPYTKAQIVSGKYIIGLAVQILVFLLISAVQLIRMGTNGGLHGGEYLFLVTLMLLLCCFSTSFTLPVMFKFGVEKGRMAYYIILGAACSVLFLIPYLSTEAQSTTVPPAPLLLLLCLLAVGLYALSWFLSIVFYRKREI